MTTANNLERLQPDSTQQLSDYFVNLALKGGGDSARGRYFFALYAVEAAMLVKLENYNPKVRPGQFLSLLFDLFTHYGSEGQQISEKELKSVIHQALDESYASFIAKLSNFDLKQLAQVTDRCVKLKLREVEVLKRYGTDLGLVVDGLPMWQVFGFFPDVANRESGGREKHPAARKLLEKIRTKFAESYTLTIEQYLDSMTPESISTETNIIATKTLASLPFAPIRLINHELHILNQHANLTPDDYDFALLYALLTDVPPNKNIRKKSTLSEEDITENHPRLWQAPDYLVSQDDSLRAMHFEDYTERQEARNFELARLGLSHAFPDVIAAIDEQLQNEAAFKGLEAGSDWLTLIQDLANDIDQSAADVRTELVKNFKVIKASKRKKKKSD